MRSYGLWCIMYSTSRGNKVNGQRGLLAHDFHILSLRKADKLGVEGVRTKC